MRVAAVAALAVLTVALAGCGGTDLGAGSESSAGLLKPGALVYWQTVSDPDSDQWEQVEALLEKFPDGDRWIAELKNELADEGVTWEGDVEPALGSVVEVAVYLGAGASPAVVGLTNPNDKDKLLELVRKLNAKSDEPVVSRVVGEWVAISDSQQAIDAALKDEGARSLADEDTFKSAMEDLPDDALSRVYVDPARAIDLAGEGPGRNALGMLGLDDLDFAGAWGKAKEDGAELAVALRGEDADRLLGAGEPYASKLLEKVPDDAFAFLTFQGGGLRQQLDGIRDNPLFEMGLREFERESGIDVGEVIALLEGEIAFYVRPAAPLPEFTFLLDSQDAAGARTSVERILRLAADRLEGEVTEDGEVTTARFDGFTVNVGSLDGLVVITTRKSGIADLQEAGDKLPDSERYQAALEAAGAPDQYTGLAYVDLADALEMIRSYLGFAGESDELPPQVSRNLEPLRSLVAYGTQEGTLSTYLAFLEID